MEPFHSNGSCKNYEPPLFVVDDVPYQNYDILSFPVTEIEEIFILKGVDAAIYGPKGKRGIIVVTTKRNKPPYENNKDIELRSEEVQEVMGQVPAWIVRWGITLLFLVVVALLVGSCFFKYPDVITADMTLTGQHPATAVVTRAAGKIQELLVRDNRPVRQGDWLAVIENHADTDDAIYLDKALERSGSDVDSLDKALSKYKELSLGDMQAAYSGLLSALHACINYREIDYYPQK